MKTRSALLMCAALAILGYNLAPQEASAQNNKAMSPSVKHPPKIVPRSKWHRVKAVRTNCYTNVRDCAGFATFGGFNYAVACSIWWNNGASGRTNFSLKAHQRFEYYVRYNDTGACIAEQYAPPNASRYYLHVNN